MPSGISGKLLSGAIGGNTIAGLYKYDFTEDVDVLDATTGADGGFDNPDAGVQKGELTIDCYFDKSVGGFAPFGVGALMTNVVISDDPDLPAWLDMPLGRVVRRQKTGEVKGRLEYRVTVRTVGPYSYTGG